jgi:hypothetical protein
MISIFCLVLLTQVSAHKHCFSVSRVSNHHIQDDMSKIEYSHHTVIVQHESDDESSNQISANAIQHSALCGGTGVVCPKDAKWKDSNQTSSDDNLSEEEKRKIRCGLVYGASFYVQEYRERCFIAKGTHTMKISVNTSRDALSKLETAWSAITNPGIGNATDVTCPGLTIWRTILNGDVTDISINARESFDPNQADSDLLKRIKPFLYNNISVDLSKLTWWQILLIAIAAIVAVIGMLVMCVYFDVPDRCGCR